jgi:hypothetical protein
LKCFSLGGSSFLPKNLVDGTVVAVFHHCRRGQGERDQPKECPIFQEGDISAGKENGLSMSNANAESVLTNAVGVYALCPLSQCTLTLCEAGSGRVGAVSGQRLCHVAETNKVHAF